MLSGEGNEKGEKTRIGLISKKVTLHVQHTFFVHFFAVVLHDYNVKLPETSWLHVYGGNVVRVLVHFFFFIFAATKFHVVPPTENVSFVFSSGFKNSITISCTDYSCTAVRR